MTRLVKIEEQIPQKVESKEAIWICRCGLSRNQPFCDGSHKKTLDEKKDKIYVYEDDKRVEV